MSSRIQFAFLWHHKAVRIRSGFSAVEPLFSLRFNHVGLCHLCLFTVALPFSLVCLLGSILTFLLLASIPLSAQTTTNPPPYSPWSQQSPTGGPPPARGGAGAVFDPSTGGMILFGGSPFGNPPPIFNDVWVLSNVDGLSGTPAWTQLTPTGTPPSPRGEVQNSVAYDPANNLLILYGGNPNRPFCNGVANDLWVLSHANGQGGTPAWTQLVQAAPGPLRQDPSLVYDPNSNRLILFGGSANACGNPTNDVWVLSNANGIGGTPTWTQLLTSGGPPAPRTNHTAVYDPATKTMMVFGGQTATTIVNDVWILSNADGSSATSVWTQLSPSDALPPGRWGHSAVYDHASNTMTIFGGAGPGGNSAFGNEYNDTWILANANGINGTPAWTQLAASGTLPNPNPLPNPRNSHNAVFNPRSGRMTIYGGFICPGGFCSATGEVWVLSPIPVNTCGATINTAGNYILASDLPNCVGDGIDIVTSNVLLYLANHQISGPGITTDTAGVFVGRGVSSGVSNVTVVGPATTSNFQSGVTFEGVSNSSVSGVTASANQFGFSPNAAFHANNPNLHSTANTFSNNTATGNNQHGFSLNGGDKSAFTGNTASQNGVAGFLLFSAVGNILTGNTANQNGGQGITAQSTGTATGNVIQNNTALSNTGFDLEDDNVGCANTWRNNTFGRASQSCIYSGTVLTVRANSVTKFFGDPVPTLTYTITGFVNSDTAAVLSGAPVLSTTATATSPVGTYPITVSQGTLSSATYTFNFVSGTLQVYAAPPTASSAVAEYLYEGANDSANLAGWSINTLTGVLTPVGPSPLPTPAPTSVVVADPLVRSLYVTSNASGTVSAYAIDRTTGALNSNPSFNFGLAGASQAAEDPTGQFLYADSNSTQQLFSFGIAQVNGVPFPLTGAISQPGQIYKILIHSNGKFLYLADGAASLIYSFIIDPGKGAPIPVPGSPLLTIPGAGAAAIDPLGRFVFVAQTQGGAMITGYGIDPTSGSLFPLSWGSLVADAPAVSIAIDPRGRFLFVSRANATTATYTIDQTSGLLTPIGTPPVAGGGLGTVVEPTGNFLFTSCGLACGGPAIAAFRIDQHSGQLDPSVGKFPALGFNLSLATALASFPTSTSVTASPNPVVYGQPTTLTATVLSGGSAVSPGTVTFTDTLTGTALGTFSLINGTATVNVNTLAVGTHTITASYSGSSFFPASSGSTIVTVAPTVLTVTADNKTKFFGDVVPALTATLTGFVNGDTAATAVTGAPALSTVVTAVTPAGSYPIFAAQGTLASLNYMFVFAIGTLTVTPPASVSLPATRQTTVTGGATDTYVTPFAVSQDGFITNWQTEFAGGTFPNGVPGVPAGVQLKVFRNTLSVLQVVAQGVVHDPRPILQQRFGASYPFFTDVSSLTTFTEAPIPVMAGDLIGITIYADPAAGAYFYPFVGPPGTLIVPHNVLLGQTINPTDPFTGSLTSPPALSFTIYLASTSNPLTLMNNFLVTGDYSAAGVTLRGTGVSGLATGTITIPTSGQDATNGIPIGADIVGAYEYWITLENTPSPSGNSGTFRGYSISGQQIGNDLQYTDGNFTGTMRVYRADVLPYLALSNGVRVASGSHTVSLPDGGNALPLTEGATLVVIWRVISPNFPLKAVVLYDGSAAVTNTSMLQVVQGFYDAAGMGGQPQARTTNIYSFGGSWNSSSSTVSLVGGSRYGTVLNPGAWAGLVLSTLVNNTDNDGILDIWKDGPAAPDFHAGQRGYYDVKFGQWIPLPGAMHGQKDLFVQLDFMCTTVRADGTCDPAGRSELPVVDAQGHDPMVIMQQVFASHGIALHLMLGNAIQAETCTDNLTANPPQLCKYPNQLGVVDWKLGHLLLKDWPRNPGACGAGGDCSPRFAFGAKDSYHYLLMGESLGFPAWNTTWGTLTGITVSNGITTINTTDRGSGINLCPSRITITGVLGNPSLNGVYNTTGSCADSRTITISTPNVPNWSYPNNTLAEPIAGVTSGTTSSISGFSDLGGEDSDVTLAKWETSPTQDMSKRVNVQVGTMVHETGHTLGLPHGGAYDDTQGSYQHTFEVNCKTNYQSVMNYMFQLDGLGQNHAVDFSDQTLTTLNESQVGSTTQLLDISGAPANYQTSSWYVPWTSNSTASPATLHCDGTALAGDKAYRITDPISPINPAWTNGQDLNFNGQLDTSMRGYNDVAHMDLRQLGAVSGQFVALANLLSFGNINSPLNVSAGGNVTLGSGGTITLGSGGTVTMGSGGSATLSSGGTIALGGGGNVTLGSGGTVTLSSNGTITMGSGGNVILGSAGSFVLGSSGGTITMGSGGSVTLGGGGNVTLGSGGTILLGSGGSVVLGAGGGYTLDSSGGTIILGSGGNVILGSGGNVTLGSGGTITLGAGGNIALGSGGTLALGSGGTIAMGSGGNVALGSGGTVTLGSGGTIIMGSGGNVTLGGGGNVTLGSGGTVTLGSGGNVALGSGGTVTLGSGGTVTLGSGGNVTVASGGNVTLGSAGTITLASGGTVTIGSGGNVTLGSGGTVALGSGGNIILGSGGTVALGSGGLVTLGSGGTVTLGSGGTITLGAGGSYTGSAGDVITVRAGGSIALGNGGTLALGSGGNISLGSGGTITMGSGGTVTLGSGGNLTLGSGGTITTGSGGTVTLGSGGNVTLGSGGTVALGSGGNIALGRGGNVTVGSGGTVALGSGGNTILGSGGTITMGSGGTLALGSGGTVTLGAGGTYVFGSRGTVALGSGGNIALGSGGNTILGSGGTISLGSGGATTVSSEGGVTLGSGGAPTLNEITYDDANSIVRPPDAPTLTRITTTSGPAVVVNWTPPVFGVVSSYTIYRSENNGTPVAIGTVTGNPPATTFTDTNPSSAATVAYTISTGVIDPTTQTTRQSPPSVPALLAQTIIFGPLPNTKVGDMVPVSATASSGLPVSFSTMGNCMLAGQSTSPTTVQTTAVGSCTVTASQSGNTTYVAAVSVSQAFSIAPATQTKYNQSIVFPALGTHTYGDPDFTLLATASSNLPVAYTVSGNCSVSGSTLHITGAGSCTVTASQGGNADYNAAPSVSRSFVINKASSTVAVNFSPATNNGNGTFSAIYTGKAVTASAVVSGVGTGIMQSVAFGNSCTTLTNVGTCTATPAYAGDANHNGSQGSATLTVNPAATTTGLSASPNPSTLGQSVMLTATIGAVAPGAGAPTGTVTFLDGNIVLATRTLTNASATFSTTALAAGNHSLIASYGGDANFLSSTSPVLVQGVACGVLISVSPSSVARGGSITVTSKVISCSTVAQTVVVQFTLSGPVQTPGCTQTTSVMFTTKPFTLPPNTAQSVSVPFQVPKQICPGTYSLTSTVMVNGTAIYSSSTSLTITGP